MEAEVESPPALFARIYGKKVGDYQLVNAWWTERHGEPLNEVLLPPLGIMVEHNGEPIAAVWCYESFGIGVCHIECPVSRPNLDFATARRAFALAIEAVVVIAKAHGDYCFFKAWPQTDSMIRVISSLGFKPCTPDGRGLFLTRE